MQRSTVTTPEPFACAGLSDAEMRNLPVVQPREFVFLLFIPLAFSFQIILVVQPAADRTTARQSLGNVFPLHIVAPELDNQHVFLRAPFGLLLGRRRERVRRGGRAAFAGGTGRGNQGSQGGERCMGASVLLAVEMGRSGGGRDVGGGGRGGRRDQGIVPGRGGDGDGPREGRRRGSRRRG